jgi:alpha-L-rhamnosidase
MGYCTSNQANSMMSIPLSLRAFHAFLFTCVAGSVLAADNVTDLRCEYNVNPVGIDAVKPRLFWKLDSPERGARQTAYQVLVASSEDLLRRNAGDLWDSGQVMSDQSTFVPYAGKLLTSRQCCFWKVRSWNQRGDASDWSVAACWTMGLLADTDWQGKWIASDLDLMDYQKTLRALPDFGMEPETELWATADKCRQMTAAVSSAPAVWLRKEFETPRTIRRALATICGLGHFELYINGQRIGDHQLDPAYTDYQKRVLYLTHDATQSLRNGRNAVGVVLGNGWFNLITPHVLRYHVADYIAPPQLRFDLDLEFTDGSHTIIGSDDSWKCTTNGPIRFNCILAGETYDARNEMPGWAEPGFNEVNWKSAKLVPAPAGRLVSQQLRPVRKVQTLPAVSVKKLDAAWRFDLGVETAGWAKLRAKGKPGQEITIVLPGSDSHTLGRYQTSKYICCGSGIEEIEPRFCYAGFRYVDVTGLDYEPSITDCVGQMVCTDFEPAGSFACSDERLNKLQKILLRTVRNYVVHIPNDPTREKAGWTQDIETGFFETAYNFNAATMYAKWQRDFLDAIQPNGYMPPVVPSRFDGPTINGPWWGGVVVYAPWWIYEFYGDRELLAESYPAMKGHFKYLNSIATNGIVTWGLGDWMEVGSVRPKRTPVPLTSTCAFYWFACILRDTATILDKPDEAKQFAAAAAEIRAAYNREFFNSETGDYASGSQTAQLVSLYFGLVPEDKRELVRRRLAERVANDNNHLTTGFVGTPLLLPGLTELALPELAWEIATQTSHPSFIDAILNRGNTVMKENWDGGLVQMPSLQGPIGTWFYYALAGIRRDPGTPGFKHIIIRPEFAGNLTWVKAHHATLYGRVVSNWRRDGEQLTMEVTIPPNTSATVHVPATRIEDVTEGDTPAREAVGVRFLRMQRGAAEFAVEAGSYTFHSVSISAAAFGAAPTCETHQDLSYVLQPDGSIAPIRSTSDWEERRRHIVAGMEMVMGPIPRPARPLPLDVEILEEHRADDFVRRKVAYHTDQQDARVHAWLMLPTNGTAEKHPAMLCLHQTTPEGKDSPAGLADRPTLHYALELVRRGYVTLSPDYPSLGEYDHDFETDAYQSGSMKAIYDNVRAIDLLQSLPEVDPERIGCIGHSLGGHNGLFTAVFDARIKAVVTCCGFTRAHKYMGGDLQGWSGPRYMPLIASLYGNDPDRIPFDFTEVIAAIAPRAIYIVAPLHDDNFDVDGVRGVVAAAEPIYKLYGRADGLQVVYPDCGHDFPDSARQAAYAFLDKSLRESP